MPAAGPSLDFEGFPSLADIEVAANAYVTGQKLCVFELLPHVCTKCPKGKDLACGSFCGNRIGPWPKASVLTATMHQFQYRTS